MKRVAAVLILALVLAGCRSNQSVWDAQGSSAVHLKQLIIWIVAICSLVWTAVIVVMIWALFRSQDNQSDPHPQIEKRMTYAVAGSVVLTVLIITGFTIASFVTTRNLSEAKAGDLTIKVSGVQWWWKVSYMGSTPELSFDTANEIHIPVGKSVRLQLEADDVIHSFWVPSLAGKQDLIPGRSNQLTLRAERPGIYRGQCAEYCGLQHSHMATFIVAEPEADFQRWAEAQKKEAAEPTDTEIEAGKAVFLAKPCAACHTIRGTEATGSSGPDLTHIGSRQTIAAGLFETTRGSLAAWIADPQTLKPGNNMPLVPLASDELRQVSAYLASLK
jgi:cytochrome c oxidase subunit 2